MFPTALPWQMTRLAGACNTTNPMIGCEMQYSRESFAAQSVEVVRNHADGARSSVAPEDRSGWKHLHENAVAIEDVDGGAYDESQERRLVQSSQALQALRRRGQDDKGANDEVTRRRELIRRFLRIDLVTGQHPENARKTNDSQRSSTRRKMSHR